MDNEKRGGRQKHRDKETEEDKKGGAGQESQSDHTLIVAAQCWTAVI